MYLNDARRRVVEGITHGECLIQFRVAAQGCWSCWIVKADHPADAWRLDWSARGQNAGVVHGAGKLETNQGVATYRFRTRQLKPILDGLGSRVNLCILNPTLEAGHTHDEQYAHDRYSDHEFDQAEASFAIP